MSKYTLPIDKIATESNVEAYLESFECFRPSYIKKITGLFVGMDFIKAMCIMDELYKQYDYGYTKCIKDELENE